MEDNLLKLIVLLLLYKPLSLFCLVLYRSVRVSIHATDKTVNRLIIEEKESNDEINGQN